VNQSISNKVGRNKVRSAKKGGTQKTAQIKKKTKERNTDKLGQKRQKEDRQSD
jgi:hypothetical protein